MCAISIGRDCDSKGSALRELAAERCVPTSAAAANERVRQAGASIAVSGPIASVEPDMQFHASLVEAIGSPRLERMYRSLVDEVRVCMAQVQGRKLLSVEQIAAEHQEILEHLEAGDADSAVACLEGAPEPSERATRGGAKPIDLKQVAPHRLF